MLQYLFFHLFSHTIIQAFITTGVSVQLMKWITLASPAQKFSTSSINSGQQF